jgi:hypothetical protein
MADIGPGLRACEEMPNSSFRGAGVAREPGTHEHRSSNILEIRVFLGSGLGPSGRPGMTFLGKNNSLTRSFAGKTILADTTVNLLIESER